MNSPGLWRAKHGRARRGRRGTVYIAVLGVALIASLCALAGMQLARSELKNARRGNDLQRAQLLAASAVELAVAKMNRAPLDNHQWRTAYANGVETAPIALNGGTMSHKLVDDDGSLSDDVIDPVWVYGYGRVGDAVWVERAGVRNDRGQPLECLNTCLHCSGQLNVSNGANLAVSGAPASTDGNLNIVGTIAGDAHALTRTGAGTITGVATIPAARKGVPWPAIYADYVAKATPIPYSANLSRFVLAPGVNELGGGLNSRGLYYINTGNRPLNINRARLRGTLIVDAGTSTVMVNDHCLMEPHRPDFPVLILRGTTTLSIESGSALSESSEARNFNPAGAPYRDATDSDQADSYPSEIRGLVHVIGPLTLSGNGVHRGAILVQGPVTVSYGSPAIYHDRNLIMNPPWGYSSNPNGATMSVRSQTWTRQSSP